MSGAVREFVPENEADEDFFELFMTTGRALAACANLPDGVLSAKQRKQLVKAIAASREANASGSTLERKRVFTASLCLAQTILAGARGRRLERACPKCGSPEPACIIDFEGCCAIDCETLDML